MTSQLDMEKLITAPRLNGASTRAKFADLSLPDFSTQTMRRSRDMRRQT